MNIIWYFVKFKDRIYFWEGTGTNYSLDGFEMVFTRHKLQYIIQYYITSGLLVVVSWVCCYRMNEIGDLQSITKRKKKPEIKFPRKSARTVFEKLKLLPNLSEFDKKQLKIYRPRGLHR